MKFAVLDKKMRAFELSMDQKITPETYIVARLDGRGFTRLTKEVLTLQRPFDETFRNAMIETVKHVMSCGFNITYGYTESDEISLLFDIEENNFDRKTRKLTSILAGEASAKFTQSMGTLGVFDCRLIPLPNVNLVADYFRWRAEDANRNALNAWCYWKLRDKGLTAQAATKQLQGKSVSDKNELLFQLGINYNDLPSWQKRGIGFYYERFDKTAINLKTNKTTTVSRRQFKIDKELVMGNSYNLLIKEKAEGLAIVE